MLTNVFIVAAEYDIPFPRISFIVLGTLLVVAGASVAMFFMLVRRWTSRRQWVSLAEWAQNRGMKFAPAQQRDQLPRPIEQLTRLDPKLRISLGKDKLLIVQFDTKPSQLAEPTVDPTNVVENPAPKRATWNAIIRPLGPGRTHAPAALRPAHLAPGESLIGLFELSPFHSLSNERFAALGVDGRAANQLIESSARALLPGDVGLLLFEEQMVLDFSGRPFDPVELDRMIAVAEQIARVG